MLLRIAKFAELVLVIIMIACAIKIVTTAWGSDGIYLDNLHTVLAAMLIFGVACAFNIVLCMHIDRIIDDIRHRQYLAELRRSEARSFQAAWPTMKPPHSGRRRAGPQRLASFSERIGSPVPGDMPISDPPPHRPRG